MNRKTAIDEGLRKTKAKNIIRNPLTIKHNIECHICRHKLVETF